jgi:hypothetical protein
MKAVGRQKRGKAPQKRGKERDGKRGKIVLKTRQKTRKQP